MKKTALILTGAILAGAIFPLAGCGGDGGSVGKVNGNFKEEATQEQVAQSLSKVNLEESFDMVNGFGFELKADVDFSMNMKATAGEETLSDSQASGGVNAEYKFTFAMAENAPVIAGAGKLGVDVKSSGTAGGTSGDSQTKIDLSVYNDSDYVYLNGALSGDKSETAKIKYSIADLIGEIGGSGNVTPPEVLPPVEEDPNAPGEETPDLPGNTGDTDVSESETITGGIDLSTAIATLQAKGFKVYIDDAKGVKMKISADENLIKSIIGETDLPVDGDKLAFTASTFDLYFVFNEDGKFTQFGLDVNIAASVNVSTVTVSQSTSFTLKGGISLKTYAGKVTLPGGIATDESYQLETL